MALLDIDSRQALCHSIKAGSMTLVSNQTKE